MKLFPKLNDENAIRSVFLYLTIAAAFYLSAPYLDVQMALAQGDHGRDLYAFDRILHGEHPYKDFWWVYGPLMPYYYAIFFKMFGTTVMSVIVGKLTLVILNTTLFYLILVRFAAPALSFLGAVYYLLHQEDFFFTYNHIGGLTFILLTMLLLAHYLTSRKTAYLYTSLVIIILLALTKLNFGVVMLAAVTTTVWMFDAKYLSASKNKKIFYLSALFGVPLITFLIYAWFVQGLTFTEIRQCLPFLPGDQPHEFPLTQTSSALIVYLATILKSSLFAILVFFLMLLGGAHMIQNLVSRSTAKTALSPAMITFAIFAAGLTVLNLHEFLRSNIWYRLGWAEPPFYLFVFLLIGCLWSSVKPAIKTCIFLALAFICVLQGANHIYRAGVLNLGPGLNKTIRAPENYLDHPRGKIYLAVNTPGWIETALTTSQILDRLVGPDETFFALPYDPLYHYLTGRKSPTRQLIFFDHIHISNEQEKSVIAELENNKTNWILLSSRMKSTEYGLGTFGETYCPLLSDYIFKNFHVVYELGDWTFHPGWTDPHGVRILKRDRPL